VLFYWEPIDVKLLRWYNQMVHIGYSPDIDRN
jgi:hypothetical protein